MSDPGHRVVPCRCDCGIERDVLVFALRSGKSTSCGCLKREQVGTLVKRTRWRDSHGRSKDPLYLLWKRIRTRCYDPRSDSYPWYGSVGIGVYEPWRTDAGAFIDYIERELGPRPSGMSLDRIDPFGNYEPGNLRWATQQQQVTNTRRAAIRDGC